MLFEPVTFASGATAKNRLMLASLTNTQSEDDGRCTREERRFLERRAEGGFAIVATCASHVMKEGKGFPGQLGCFDDALLPGLTELAQRLNAHGALSLVQLYHGGVRSPSALTGVQPTSASVFQEDRPGFEAPRAATEADIEAVIEAFEAAAVRCARAGFSGVELHAAHGYLLSQFLSRTMNTREDAWGGPIEHRARLVREIARRVRSAVPPPFVVGARLSPEDYGFARGLDVDETVQVAAWLAEDGLDFIHLSLWDFRRLCLKHPDEHAVRLVRRALPSHVRIAAAGKVWTREDAESVIGLGADIVALGRAAIANPDWPLRAGEPGFSPVHTPLTPDELAERDVSPSFVRYLRGLRLVRDPD
jgi:2,4-dienoyl-CoA reductase-like NADH-dependent reductase (Old Yellow Enzyme family)